MEKEGGTVNVTMKVLTLKIEVDESGKVNADLKHKCKTTKDALGLIQEFVDRKSRKKDA